MPTFGPTATERPGRFATIDFGAGLFRAGQLITDACAILCYGTCLDLNEGLLPKPIRFVTFAITREQWRSAVEGRNAPLTEWSGRAPAPTASEADKGAWTRSTPRLRSK